MLKSTILFSGLCALMALVPARNSHATWDPNFYYMECYVDTGPHAYERNSCYSFVPVGPATAHAYFTPSTQVLVLATYHPFQWSVAACNSLPDAVDPCVVSIGNHQEKTVTFSVPYYSLSVSGTAGYDMGTIP